MYERTFEDAYLGDDVDYSELPLNFHTYSPRDQHRILLRMAAIGEAVTNDIDLETAPLPELTLEEATVRLAIQ